jgi:hypothetical protein
MEVLIGLTLFAMLMSVMFLIFWRCSKVTEIITKERHLYEKLVVVQSRLQNVLSKSIFNKNIKALSSYFYIEEAKGSLGKSLIFKFENDIELTNDFLLLLGAKIYVDEQKQLCLALWQHEEPLKEVPQNVRKEVLLDGISNLDIEFFAPPLLATNSKAQKNEEMPLDRCTWLSTWPQEATLRPALIKLICHRGPKKEPLTFWFMVPKEIQTIIYRTK